MAPSGWRVEFTTHAARDVRRLDPPVRRRIYDALEKVSRDQPVGDVIRLKDSDEWRLRVGDWRVRFRRYPHAREIRVVRVLPRVGPIATDDPLVVLGRHRADEPCTLQAADLDASGRLATMAR